MPASFCLVLEAGVVSDETASVAGVVADGTSVLGASVAFSVSAGVVGCATVVAVVVGAT